MIPYHINAGFPLRGLLPQGRSGAEGWQNDAQQNDFYSESFDRKYKMLFPLFDVVVDDGLQLHFRQTTLLSKIHRPTPFPQGGAF
jgi:hypothetical protein